MNKSSIGSGLNPVRVGCCVMLMNLLRDMVNLDKTGFLGVTDCIGLLVSNGFLGSTGFLSSSGHIGSGLLEKLLGTY